MNNCTTCINAYTKQNSFWEYENVYICSLDNHYIGYRDDAEKECCKKYVPIFLII
jgi:hypothetical protein